MSKEERPAHTKPQRAPTCGHRNAGPRSALTVWSEGIEWRKSFFSTIPSSALCISLPLTFNYCKIQYCFFLKKKKNVCVLYNIRSLIFTPQTSETLCVCYQHSPCVGFEVKQFPQGRRNNSSLKYLCFVLFPLPCILPNILRSCNHK